MKNKDLISRLNDLKKSKSIESIEGSMLNGIRGGQGKLEIPCSTKSKCGKNSACNGNN
ncbi:hypothetical protein [Myroides sp. WP-1]|uniref:hypothetical protein n=1 Tax=unclassified Myroides TaxID=2642485 RepID=UPI0015FDD220|nr:hypothetical protein [Myroides sp. WP-1]MBB1138306.1 hypothetical protein [Myroides sp. WP-1]